MERFIERYEDRIEGIIAGFDRIWFQGTQQSLCHEKGMEIFLSSQRVLYKDFGVYAEAVSEQIKEHAKKVAAKLARPLIHVPSPKQSKEEIAKKIAERDQIKEGLICILKCVEPCQSFTIRKNNQTKHLDLVMQQRQCLHLYYYYMDREFGFMNVRLQSWFPFTTQIYINGREYLARQMDKRGMKYEKKENCFTWVEDISKAQKILSKLDEYKWEGVLTQFAKRANPLIKAKQGVSLRNYYWTIRQCEYATDILFSSRESLAQIYPALVDHAFKQFSSKDVMRFLQRRTNSSFNGEATSNIKERIEGTRIKHWVEENSIKMYDKQGSVLRIETTINNPKRFRVCRRVRRYKRIVMKWVPMRKGVVDLRRRVEVARSANERYLDALSVVGLSTPSVKLLDTVSRPTEKNGRRYRPLRPISSEDASFFKAIMNGKFFTQGFRNKQLQLLLPQFSPPAITRLLRLLCAHNLIHKVSRTNFYRITKHGQEVMSTALIFRQSNIALLAA